MRPSRLTPGGASHDRARGDEVVPPPGADAVPRRPVWLRGGPVERWLHLRRTLGPPSSLSRKGTLGGRAKVV